MWNKLCLNRYSSYTRFLMSKIGHFNKLKLLVILIAY